jgi:hypothetical protein
MGEMMGRHVIGAVKGENVRKQKIKEESLLEK